jgi:hypothetical protein
MLTSKLFLLPQSKNIIKILDGKWHSSTVKRVSVTFPDKGTVSQVIVNLLLLGTVALQICTSYAAAFSLYLKILPSSPSNKLLLCPSGRTFTDLLILMKAASLLYINSYKYRLVKAAGNV